MGAPVAFFEVISQNPDRIREFYTELFGWTTADSGQPGYWLADTAAGSEAIGGGIGGPQPGETSGRTTIYMPDTNGHTYQLFDSRGCPSRIDAAARFRAS